jgi:hypothetical protein
MRQPSEPESLVSEELQFAISGCKWYEYLFGRERGCNFHGKRWFEGYIFTTDTRFFDIHLNYLSANQIDNYQLFFAPLEVFCCAGDHPSSCNVRTRILNTRSSMIVVLGVLRGIRFGRGGYAASAMETLDRTFVGLAA